MGLFTWIREAARRMLDGGLIKNKTGIQICSSPEMREAIERWQRIYANKPPWKSDTVKSLNLGAAVATEFARLITLELKSEAAGSERAEYINGVYAEMLTGLRRQVERACAVGGMAIKPYLANGKIHIDFADNTMFYPASYDTDGDITGAVFVSRKVMGDKYYTKLECHDFNGNAETIRNIAFVSGNKNELGRKTALGDVPEWAALLPEGVITNISRPLFAYFRTPMANTADEDSPLGVSVFSRAEELLCEADEQWSRFLWEFDGGELSVHLSEDNFRKDDNGNAILDKHGKRLFQLLEGGDYSGKNFHEVFAPALRDASYLNGLNAILKRIEFNCSLAYGTLSDPQNVDKTAEEIRASKQRSYSAVSDMQQALERALRHTAQIIDVWCTIGGLAPAGDYELSFEWDDSIVSDRQREYTERQSMVSVGAMQPWELRAWYLGESEEQAKKMVLGAPEGAEE